MAKVLLLDGYNLAFRSFYALPELTRTDGFPTGAIHGWVKTLWKLEDMEQGDAMGIFFDEGGSSRHEAVLSDYKANRSEMPATLEQQIPEIREVSARMGYPDISRQGIEADDLLASAANRLASEGHRVVIVSADKDLAQCIRPGITQLFPAPTANPRLGWRRLDVEGVKKKFGVPPERLPDYLALIGDTSDNIRGLDGVGPKTAAKWLDAYENLAGVCDHADELTPKRFRELILLERERLEQNLQLVTLERHHESPPIENGTLDLPGLEEFLIGMEMRKSAAQARDRYGLGL